MQLIPHAEHVSKPRSRLRYQRIDGMPPRGFNEPKEDEDPSGLSKLNLVGKDYYSGSGTGPEIEKVSAQIWGAPLVNLAVKLATRQPLPSGLAAVHDNATYMNTGKLVQTDPFRRPVGAPAWQSQTPDFPFLGTSLFQLARNLRNKLQTAQMPNILQQSAPLRGTVGALGGAAAAAGAGWLSNILNQKNTPLSHYALGGAGLAGLLAYGRGTHK
jgi:hypothetical protein